MSGKQFPSIVYTSLALLVMGPLLAPGYVLALDLVSAPHILWPEQLTNDFPLRVLMVWADWLLPSYVVQKFLLVAVLVLAGLGMHRLVQHIGAADKWWLTAYFAGALYMVNPFTYGRFVTGQWLVLFGMALLPWFARAMLQLTASPGRKRAVVAGLWAAAVCMVSIHSVVPLVIVGSLIVALRLWQLRKRRAGQWQLARFAALAAGVCLLLNAYWLVPAALGRGEAVRTAGSFGAGDQAAFATLGETAVEKLGNVLALQGFWFEGRGLVRLPQDGAPWWPLLVLVLLALVVYGAVAAWKKQRGIAAVFISCIVTGGLLASGIGSGWLADHIPLFAGYREPQKFAMLVALGYGVFAAYGAAGIWDRARQGRQSTYVLPALGVIFTALPFQLTPVMFWAANNQLRAADYPRGWYQANERLNRDRGDYEVVFLPWHLYLYAGFAGQTVANPAPAFFDRPVVVSDDPEYKGTSLSGSTRFKRQVDRLLEQAGGSTTRLGQELAKLDVKYILLAETSDFGRYDYLDKQTNIKLAADYDGMRLYEVLAEK